MQQPQPDTGYTEAEALRDEMEDLKAEQRQRITARDYLPYLTLAAIGYIADSSDGHPARLLMLPPVCCVLGWLYLMNDQKISALGSHVRTVIVPRLRELIATDRPDATHLFGWESAHRSDRRRASRKRLQLAVDLMLYAVAPLAALTVYATSTSAHSATAIAVGLAELAPTAVLVKQFLNYSDLRKPTDQPHDT